MLKKFKETLDVGSFVWILEQEKEWEKLLQIAKENIDLIAYYGKHLYEDYPDEITDLTHEWIKISLEEASERKAYRKVGKLISSYAKYGDEKNARFCVMTIKNAPKNKMK